MPVHFWVLKETHLSLLEWRESYKTVTAHFGMNNPIIS